MAFDRVQEVVEYIALDKPEAARAWAISVFEAVEKLAEFPLRGRVVPEVGREDLRELIHRGYRVVYRIEESDIHILTVRHSLQLLDRSETT